MGEYWTSVEQELEGNKPETMGKGFWNDLAVNGDLTEEDMRKYGEFFNWRKLSDHQKMSLDFIRENADRVHWDRITQRIKMTEDFIDEFADKVTWDYVWSYQSVSEAFIERHAKEANWDRIARIQRYSIDFAVKHADVIPLEKALAYCKKKITDEWIDKHLDIINEKHEDKYGIYNNNSWGALACHCKWSEEFMIKHAKYFDKNAWKSISWHQKMGEDFIRKYAKKLDWWSLWHNKKIGNLNREFVREMKKNGVDVGVYYKDY